MQAIGLGVATLVVSSLLLKAILKLLLGLMTLWSVGEVYPYTAQSVGMPQSNLYAFVTETTSTVWHELLSLGGEQPAAAPLPIAQPARSIVREYPERRADGSVWIVRLWSDGQYQDMAQLEPPGAQR